MITRIADDIRLSLRSSATEINRVLEARVSTLEGVPPKLAESMRYSLLSGGKRLRPILALWSCELCGGEKSSAMPAAIAVECVHAFSLIHDDLPALDDDDYRRGRPSNHRRFGEALAILSGDSLLALSFEILTRDIDDANLSARLCRELSMASGAAGLIGGEVLDLEGVSTEPDEEKVSRIHADKTGRLIQAACRMGAISARADDMQIEALSEYGRLLGLAFQVADDLLDVTGSLESTGKRTGKDAIANKQTYPRAIGIEASRKLAADLAEQAASALSTFGTTATPLAALAQFVIERTN